MDLTFEYQHKTMYPFNRRLDTAKQFSISYIIPSFDLGLSMISSAEK